MILNTKLQPPPIYKQYVYRARFDKLLSDIFDNPFALVSAPPGSGKTSLISHWVNHLAAESNRTNAQTIWITLESQDNDLFEFWNKILTSCSNSNDKLNLNQLLNTSTPINSIVDLWLNSITETKYEHFLVFDDYHQIQDPVIHNSILYLLEHIPANLHIIICTRIDPPFPLSKWRIQGKLVEIRSADLSFTESEIAHFFEHQSGLTLNPNQIVEINKRTEGWAAGLQVIALSIKGLDSDIIDQRILGFSGRHRYFADYVTDEVISHLPQDLLEFLTLTSILNKLSAPLCSTILDNSKYSSIDTQKTLIYLLQNNLFTTSLDEENEWFRLHPLFQELLQAKLRSEKSTSFIDGLYHNAAKWFFTHGAINEAINLSIKAHDHQMTADMINSTVEKADVWSIGEIRLILQWIDSLPDEIVHQRPWLRLYQSRALFISGNITESESILDQIESENIENDVQLSAQINCSRARIAAKHGRVKDTIQYAQLALNSLSPEYSLAHSSTLSSLGYAFLLAGKYEESLIWLNSAFNEAKINGFILLQVNVLVNIGWIYFQQGQNDKLELIINQGFMICQIGKQYLPIAGLLFLLQAEFQYDQGNIDNARDSLDRGLALLEQGGIEDTSLKSCFLMSKILLANGNESDAWRWLDKASDGLNKSGIERSVRVVESAKANFWLHTNQPEKTTKWISDYLSADTVDYLHETEDLILARALLANKDAKKCISICKTVEQQAINSNLKRIIVESNLILSMAYHELRQIDSSQAAFLKALILVDSLQSRQLIIDEMKYLHPIMLESQKRGVNIDILRELLNMHGPKSALISQLTQPLSAREIEVIQLIAEGLTNHEIANHLVVAETTIKKHISHIFNKLNVSSRTQVIIAARQMNIIK
jgi:LuxR family transcriptional regulator, maltose regulon positive regulatory protein